MSTPACRDKLKGIPPMPGQDKASLCSQNLCHVTSFIDGTHCTSQNPPYPINTPFPVSDRKGGWCYCCCSCFGRDTPIEASPGSFVMIQDIASGDCIQAAGADLGWRPVRVEARYGPETTTPVEGAFLVVYRYPDNHEPRQLLVSPDHLFLMAKTRQLKSVKHLVPGDALACADGRSAPVDFVAVGEYDTAFHSLLLEGDFDGTNLEGHLVNSNGVTTADYKVQVYFETDNLNARHVDPVTDEGEVLEVGTRAYKERFGSDRLERFLDDPAAWPPGFMPRRHSLVTVPPHARRLITEERAQYIRDNVKMLPKSYNLGGFYQLKLFKIYNAFYPDTVFILDWNNSTPNAYAWKLQGQNLVVINGGLIRLQGFFPQGQALVLAIMQAFLDGAGNAGEAFYAGAANVMRSVWLDILWMSLLPAGMEQLRTTLFEPLPKRLRAENPDNPIEVPATDFLMECLTNSMSSLGLPKRATPDPERLEVDRVIAAPDLGGADLDPRKTTVIEAPGA